jgi:SAM-dependent methyltransferase
MISSNNIVPSQPTVVTDGETPTVAFSSMPLWEGVQKAFGVRRHLPFALAAPINSPIRQVTSAQTISDVVNAYQSDEYTFITPPPGASAWANSLGEGYAEAVRNLIGNVRPKNILEIGGGSTWIASRLRTHFCPQSYVIVDPSVRDSAEGVEVILDYFPSARLADRLFDLILGFNVLEHVPDPLDFLRSIRMRLTPKGKVVLIFPDCERQLLRGDLNVLVHEHLSYFTEASCRFLALTAGFKVLALGRENDTFTALLEVASCHSDTVEELNESQLVLASAGAFRNLLTNTAEKIRQCLNDGHHVAFHGATVGLNTFFHITGLGSHPNIHLYDGDAAKAGLFLPACTTRIISPADESYVRNSLLVVSAMSFFEPIERFAVRTAGLNASKVLPLIGAQFNA